MLRDMVEVMDINLLDRILQAMRTAASVPTLVPELPKGVRPIHLRVLDALSRTRGDNGCSRVSDIAAALGMRMPNVTRIIREMTDLGMLEKTSDPTDGRVVLIRTTDLGEEYVDRYIVGVRQRIEHELMAEVSMDDIESMIVTIDAIRTAVDKACGRGESTAA
ncbi:MarR family winged helix-turn-helix transcriptional regulator [Bifidobacterium vansinderenii]|uniref:MarR family transcriptional regulator n=1 Tax=Bifidobacterium vansinderenii TaxID=1984871 RepID=A0A229W125_9BIFI|nr:MarR family transcriptional regulator [Bifidobacterium vansinderenii]OXN01545.1 MarR family transcriptional regulator [Bifidobacterium vansinderenii]